MRKAAKTARRPRDKSIRWPRIIKRLGAKKRAARRQGEEAEVGFVRWTPTKELAGLSP